MPQKFTRHEMAARKSANLLNTYQRIQRAAKWLVHQIQNGNLNDVAAKLRIIAANNASVGVLTVLEMSVLLTPDERQSLYTAVRETVREPTKSEIIDVSLLAYYDVLQQQDTAEA